LPANQTGVPVFLDAIQMDSYHVARSLGIALKCGLTM
jgi:hypothetical protein